MGEWEGGKGDKHLCQKTHRRYAKTEMNCTGAHLNGNTRSVFGPLDLLVRVGSLLRNNLPCSLFDQVNLLGQCRDFNFLLFNDLALLGVMLFHFFHLHVVIREGRGQFLLFRYKHIY